MRTGPDWAPVRGAPLVFVPPLPLLFSLMRVLCLSLRVAAVVALPPLCKWLALCSGSLDECNAAIGMAVASISSALPGLDSGPAKRYAAAWGVRSVLPTTAALWVWMGYATRGPASVLLSSCACDVWY